MADGHVQVAPDSTGKKIDNAELTREPTDIGGTGETVYRQRVVLGADDDPRQVVTLRGESGRAFVLVDTQVLDDIRDVLFEIKEMLEVFMSA
jgi:hypothetical protein